MKWTKETIRACRNESASIWEYVPKKIKILIASVLEAGYVETFEHSWTKHTALSFSPFKAYRISPKFNPFGPKIVKVPVENRSAYMVVHPKEKTREFLLSTVSSLPEFRGFLYKNQKSPDDRDFIMTKTAILRPEYVLFSVVE